MSKIEINQLFFFLVEIELFSFYLQWPQHAVVDFQFYFKTIVVPPVLCYLYPDSCMKKTLVCISKHKEIE